MSAASTRRIRKSPPNPAKTEPEGTERNGLDGKRWVVRRQNGQSRWVRVRTNPSEMDLGDTDYFKEPPLEELAIPVLKQKLREAARNRADAWVQQTTQWKVTRAKLVTLINQLRGEIKLRDFDAMFP